MKQETVVIVGASPKKDRYSNKAQNLLREYGHRVVPVHPQFEEIDGVPVRASLRDIKEEIDTVTLYVNPKRGEELLEQIIALHPRRVIFNPGTESEKMSAAFVAAGIEPINACTLVLLRTNQF